MGFFTWTDARRKPRKIKNGGYNRYDVIPYDGYAQVVCPDGSSIEEHCYEGYGIFGGKDIYELVVEWNRPYLRDIFQKIIEKNSWGACLAPIAEAYQEDGDSAAEAAADTVCSIDETPYIVKSEWKREIGIAIACVSSYDDVVCPYPIKIVRAHGKFDYDTLLPSLSYQ